MSQNNWSLIFILLGVFSCQEALETDQQKDLPNIIWLMAEDISLDLACYGMPAVKTPFLDQMAADGLRFDNCFSTSPICSPNRSAMMTGVHQVKINAHHHRSNRDVELSAPYKPFTYWLREAGYTCILGHHGVMGKGRKTDVNFKSTPLGPWDGKEQFGLFDKYDQFNPDEGPFFAQIQLKVTHRGDWWDDIRQQSAHPVHPDSVVLPPYYADHPTIRLDWAKYLDQMEYMDNEVGLIMTELEEKGLADNTVVIFIGDNGRCNIRGKGYLHDPGLRVPLIIKWPKGIEGGVVKQNIVSTTDITATILDLAGIDIPTYMTGKSFLAEDFQREEVYAARDLWDEIEEKSRALTSNRWKYIRNDMPEVPWDAHQAYLEFYRPAVHIMRMLKAQGKLNAETGIFFQTQKPGEELYDLQADPFELNNLVEMTEHQAILNELRNKAHSYDQLMQPVSDTYHPVHPGAVDVLAWLKKEKPESYQQMREGIEIGFRKFTQAYRASKK